MLCWKLRRLMVISDHSCDAINSMYHAWAVRVLHHIWCGTVCTVFSTSCRTNSFDRSHKWNASLNKRLVTFACDWSLWSAEWSPDLSGPPLGSSRDWRLFTVYLQMVGFPTQVLQQHLECIMPQPPVQDLSKLIAVGQALSHHTSIMTQVILPQMPFAPSDTSRICCCTAKPKFRLSS